MKKAMVMMVMCVVVLMGRALFAEDVPSVCPTAIFPFEERGEGIKGFGAKVADIMFAKMVVNPNLYLVDRQEMQKTFQEYELTLSGIVKPDEAIKVGKLTGAKVIVTGSVIEADKSLYLVAKVIGTESGRVLGESVKGKISDPIDTLVEQLAEKVTALIMKDSDKLVVKEPKMEDRIAALNKLLGNAKRPVVMVRITERHVGQATVDPAAETEITLVCKETGFEVLDPKSAADKKADIMIEGEGFSEFALRKGNIVSVKARLEVKAVDRSTDKIIAVDRQTSVEVDLTEQIAGKKALQNAAMAIAERMLPKLVNK